MDRTDAQYLELTTRACDAYRHARVIVYDLLPAGASVDTTELTSRQRDAMSTLRHAEADLELYRSDRYRHRHGQCA